MKKKSNIALKKHAKQQRSIATVGALVESANYILKHNGPRGFTANKVAEKAGVNIASFYQYFPNKEALLFYIAQTTWEQQFAKLSPILTRRGSDHACKLRDFIREFFMIEAAEADLRKALRVASIDLKDTSEFRELIAKGTEQTKAFIKEAVAVQDAGQLDFNADFIVMLVTSFAERTTDERSSGADLIRQADLLTDMLTAYFRIS